MCQVGVSPEVGFPIWRIYKSSPIWSSHIPKERAGNSKTFGMRIISIGRRVQKLLPKWYPESAIFFTQLFFDVFFKNVPFLIG
jgi:hypothetical protein